MSFPECRLGMKLFWIHGFLGLTLTHIIYIVIKKAGESEY